MRIIEPMHYFQLSFLLLTVNRRHAVVYLEMTKAHIRTHAFVDLCSEPDEHRLAADAHWTSENPRFDQEYMQ